MDDLVRAESVFLDTRRAQAAMDDARALDGQYVNTTLTFFRGSRKPDTEQVYTSERLRSRANW